MKRLSQFAAIVALVLFAIQPALASLTCAAPTPCVSGCPMAMSGMAPDCPMAGQMAATGCPENCCSQVIPQAMLSAVGLDKNRLVALDSPSAIPIAIPEAEPAAAFVPPIGSLAASPPLYILNRVFRI